MIKTAGSGCLKNRRPGRGCGIVGVGDVRLMTITTMVRKFHGSNNNNSSNNNSRSTNTGNNYDTNVTLWCTILELTV